MVSEVKLSTEIAMVVPNQVIRLKKIKRVGIRDLIPRGHEFCS